MNIESRHQCLLNPPSGKPFCSIKSVGLFDRLCILDFPALHGLRLFGLCGKITFYISQKH